MSESAGTRSRHSNGPLTLPRRLRGEADDRCIWVVVSKDLAKVRAFFGHLPSSGLAQADTVSLTAAFNDHLLASLSQRKVVALDDIPSQAPARFDARRVIGTAQMSCVLDRDATLPTGGMLAAVFAFNGVIRIRGNWESDISWGAGTAAATARVQDRAATACAFRASIGAPGMLSAATTEATAVSISILTIGMRIPEACSISRCPR